MAPITWARTLEAEVADLSVVLDLVVACSSSPPMQVTSSSSSCLKVEEALDCLGVLFPLLED